MAKQVKEFDLKTTPKLEHKNLKVRVELKEDNGADGVIEAYVSVFGNTDSYGDVIVKGAFEDSLKKKLPKGVWAHDWQQPIATTLEAKEDAHGLYIKGQLVLGVQRADEARLLLKAGAIDEFSIGFTVEDYEEKDGVRYIKKIKLYEWSPVLWGANDATELISVKSAEKKDDEEPEKPTEEAEEEVDDTGDEADGADESDESDDESDEKTAPEEKIGAVLSAKNREKVENALGALDELGKVAKEAKIHLQNLLDESEKGHKVETPTAPDGKTVLRIRQQLKVADKANEAALKTIKLLIK